MINKPFMTFLLALVLSMTVAPMTARADGFIPDVNGDGEVNIADLNAVIDFILKGETVTPIDLSKTYLSAKDFGAVGDGETDDTDALEALFEAAFMLKKSVFFDPGTYLIRRSLLLRTGMEIYGEDATLKKRSAVTTTLAAPAVKGQTYLDLVSSNGFNLGDQFCIGDPGGANRCTYGIITGIEGNRITFTNIISDQQSNFPGCVKDYDSGKVSASFSLLRSWSTRYECDGVFIHDLTLDGNRKTNEPYIWANSCIHMDSYYPGGYTGNSGMEYRNIQRDMMLRNVTIKNSPCDGISDQSEGGLIVRDCVIENSAAHGIHLGTIYSSAIIANNSLIGNGSYGSGVFFCQDVNDVVVANNTIENFSHGCSDEENGTAARNVTIRNNVFNNINGFVFNFVKATSGFHGGGFLISNNQIHNLKSFLFSGLYLVFVILANNVVNSVAGQPSRVISVTKSRNVVISGNKVLSSMSWDEPVNGTETVNLIQDANSWNN